MGLDMDFSKLQPRDILDLAIYAEQEAAEYYGRLADWLSREGKTSRSEFFHTMVAREKQHRDQIAEMRLKLFGDAPATLRDVAVWGIELPDDARMPKTLREAITVAIEAEKGAYAYYSGAIPFTSEKRAAELFETLRQSELGHRRLLEAELAKIED